MNPNKEYNVMSNVNVYRNKYNHLPFVIILNLIKKFANLSKLIDNVFLYIITGTSKLQFHKKIDINLLIE